MLIEDHRPKSSHMQITRSLRRGLRYCLQLDERDAFGFSNQIHDRSNHHHDNATKSGGATWVSAGGGVTPYINCPASGGIITTTFRSGVLTEGTLMAYVRFPTAHPAVVSSVWESSISTTPALQLDVAYGTKLLDFSVHNGSGFKSTGTTLFTSDEWALWGCSWGPNLLDLSKDGVQKTTGTGGILAAATTADGQINKELTLAVGNLDIAFLGVWDRQDNEGIAKRLLATRRSVA